VVVDAQGDDTWRATFAGQGAGLFGVGWVEEGGGDDDYEARALAQGAAVLGVGALMDRGGNDVYDVGLQGQAFSGLFGLGVLADDAGNDRYLAGGREPDHERNQDRYLSLAQGFSIGLRPFAGGGVAALIDRGGNDTYVADVYGQGASYYYSAGYLLDGGGNDTYTVYQYGQGAGIHLSLGLLVDEDGHDAYSGGILVQGVAHDFAVGGLIDRGGRDTYLADHDAQGHGMNSALGVAAGCGWRRRVRGARSVQQPGRRQQRRRARVGQPGAAARPRRPRPLLLRRLRLPAPATSSLRHRVRRGRRGAAGGQMSARRHSRNWVEAARLIAASSIFLLAVTWPGLARAQEPAATNATYDDLIFRATRYGNTEQRRSEKTAARAELFARGDAALRELMSRAHVENLMVLVLIDEMARFQMPAEKAAPVLVPFLDSEDAQTRRTAAYLLGFMPRGGQSARLRELLQDEKCRHAATADAGQVARRKGAAGDRAPAAPRRKGADPHPGRQCAARYRKRRRRARVDRGPGRSGVPGAQRRRPRARGAGLDRAGPAAQGAARPVRRRPPSDHPPAGRTRHPPRRAPLAEVAG
jgi:hypothetical protein